MAYTPTTYSPTILKTEGTTTERGGNSKSATKVTLIDPNPGQEIVPHEDLFIYVNLKANTRPKSLLTQYSDKKYSISNLNGNTVSLSSPQEAVSGNDLFKGKSNLTTDWTEIGGLKSAFGDTGNDFEGFGITSIDINIKSQVSPTVTIDFVDVRGATLFEQGSCSPYGFFFQLPYPVFELTVKGYYGKAATYYLNLVKFNTKFNSETGNMECRAEFIGYSFAFLSDIFMGYVMAASLLPNNYGFKDTLEKIYNKTVSFYNSKDGGELDVIQDFCSGPNGCLTILQLLKALNSFEKVDKQKIIDSPEYQELVQLKELYKKYNDYRVNIEEFVKRYDKSLLQQTGSNSDAVKKRPLRVVYGDLTTGAEAAKKELSVGGNLAINFDLTGGLFLNNIKDIMSTKILGNYPYQLSNKIECLLKTPSQFEEGNKTSYIIFDSQKITGKPWFGPTDFWSQNLTPTAPNSSFQPPQVTTPSYGFQSSTSSPNNQYFIDFGYILEDVYTEIKLLEDYIKVKKELITSIIDKIVEDKLTFKPTIRNVFTILLSNTEAFMEILKTVSKNAETYHSTESLEIFTSEGSINQVVEVTQKQGNTGSKVYSWPTYSEQNTNPPSDEQKFPGNNVNFLNWPEVIFVEDFLKAFLQLKEEFELLDGNVDGRAGYDNYAPINPLESRAWYNGTPNKYTEVFATEDLYRTIGERLFIALDHSLFQPVRLTADALRIPVIGGSKDWSPITPDNAKNFVGVTAELDSWNLLNSSTTKKVLQSSVGTFPTAADFIAKVKNSLNGLTEKKASEISKITSSTATQKYRFKPDDIYYVYMTDKTNGIELKKNDSQESVWIHPNPFKMETNNLIKIIPQDQIAGLKPIILTNEKFKTFLNTYQTRLVGVTSAIDFSTTEFGKSNDNFPKDLTIMDTTQYLISFDKPQLYTTLAMSFFAVNGEFSEWWKSSNLPSSSPNSVGGAIVSNMGMITFWDYGADDLNVPTGVNLTTDENKQNDIFNDNLYNNFIFGYDSITLSNDTKIDPGDDVKEDDSVFLPLVTTPLWLDNVINFRVAIRGDAVDSVAKKNYPEATQFKNLAYLFLHTLKTTPFVKRLIRSKGWGDNSGGSLLYNDSGWTDIALAILTIGKSLEGNQEPSVIWSHKAFNTIGGVAKVPKAWLLTLGSQLWRWREFTGSKQGQKWLKPLICVDCTKYNQPIGNDPLVQPSYNSFLGAKVRTNDNSKPPTFRENLKDYLETIYGTGFTTTYNANTPKSVFSNDSNRRQKGQLFNNGENYVSFRYFNHYKYRIGDKIEGFLQDYSGDGPGVDYSWPGLYIAPHHIPYVSPETFSDPGRGAGAAFTLVSGTGYDDDKGYWIGKQDYLTIMPTKVGKQEYNEEDGSDSKGPTHRSKHEDGNLGMIIQYIPDEIKDKIVEIFEAWALGGWKSDILPIVDPVNFGSTNSKLTDSYEFLKGEDSPAANVPDSAIGEESSNGSTDFFVLSLAQKKEQLLKLLTDQYWILNSTPKIWYGIGDDKINPTAGTDPKGKNKFYEDGFVVSKDQFDTYLTSFYDTYKINLPDRITELDGTKKDESGNGVPIDDEDLKLSLYRSFKSLSEKWIQRTSDNGLFFNVGGTDSQTCKNGAGKKSTLASHFTYVNRVWGDIGDTSVIDITKLNEVKENKKISLYQIITDILSDNEYLFFALPTYMNLTGQGMKDEDLKDMFRPILDITDSSCGPLFVSMYVGGTSRKLALQIGETNCKIDNEAVGDVLNNVNDDGFSLTDINQPTDMASGNFTAFKVLYGVQNQNHFKNIQLDQSEFTETAESLNVIDKLAQNQGSDRTTKGQNLNSAYLTRSYTCTIESMGNMMIQPMTYFDLQGVPMFSGAYLITEVSHSVKPNNVSTTFKGVRQPRTIVPLVTSASIAMNLTFDENATGTGTGTSLRNIGVTNSSGALGVSSKYFKEIPTSITSLFGNPVACTNNPTITSGFYRSAKGGGGFHGGLDIGFGQGFVAYTEGGYKGKKAKGNVISAYDGIVTRVGTATNFGAPSTGDFLTADYKGPIGGMIEVQYGEDGGTKPFSNGYYYIFQYGHCEAASGIIVGKKVTKGQVIGSAVWPNRMAANGSLLPSTGLHLHLQVRQKKEGSDPELILPTPFINQQESCITNVPGYVNSDSSLAQTGPVEVKYVTEDTTPEETSQYYGAILTKLGAPSTEGNLLFLRAWRRAEGSTATWNGFNTTLDLPNATRYNSVGVRNYINLDQGVEATVNTLLNSGNGEYYKNIVSTLRRGIKDKNEALNYVKGWQEKGGDLYIWSSGPKATEPLVKAYVYDVLKGKDRPTTLQKPTEPIV